MKLLKQILIFIVFTGAIYGIFTLVTKDTEVVNTAALSAGNHEQLIKEIDNDWSGKDDWDEETYDRHITMVAQSLNAGIINELDGKTLRDRINKAAYQKCVSAMNREFDRRDCDAQKLALNYSGLQTILMNERGLATNNQIVEASNTYSLYQRIIAFNNRQLGLSPRYNSSNDTWSSWASYQDRINKQKSDFIADPLFQNKLKGISDICKIYDTDSRLQDARRRFYDNLGNEIYGYFSSRCSQLQGEGNEAERAALRSRIIDIRINLANERYLPQNHHILSRMLDIKNRLD